MRGGGNEEGKQEGELRVGERLSSRRGEGRYGLVDKGEGSSQLHSVLIHNLIAEREG